MVYSRVVVVGVARVALDVGVSVTVVEADARHEIFNVRTPHMHGTHQHAVLKHDLQARHTHEQHDLHARHIWMKSTVKQNKIITSYIGS